MINWAELVTPLVPLLMNLTGVVLLFIEWYCFIAMRGRFIDLTPRPLPVGCWTLGASSGEKLVLLGIRSSLV